MQYQVGLMSSLLLQPITKLWSLCFSYLLVSKVIFGYYIQKPSLNLLLHGSNFDSFEIQENIGVLSYIFHDANVVWSL